MNASFLIGAFLFVTGIYGVFASNAFAAESDNSLKTLVFQENETLDFLLKKAQQGDAEAQFKYSWHCKDSKESDKWLKISAQNGYARAQFYLGFAYSKGLDDLEANPDLAKKWLVKATNQKFPMARVYRFYKGIGVEQNKDKALKELIMSAKAGYIDSQFFLSYAYSKSGELVFDEIEKNENKARYWLKKAAENGSDIAQYDLGIQLSLNNNYDEAIIWLKKAANQENLYAQNRLGHIYYFGKGVKKDLAEAAKWAKKAADQGDELGKSLLDLIKLQYPQADSDDKIEEEQPESKPAIKIEEKQPEADSVPTDSGSSLKTIVFKEYETIDYLKKKAEAGDAEAMFKFATKTASVSDENEYVKWLIKSAKNGYARAQFYVGIMYLEGHSNTEVNPELAKKWLTSASDKGFPIAKVYCFYKGIGVEEDKDKAWKELVRSAKFGWVESQVMLAFVYSGKAPLRFNEIDKSEEKAHYWIEKAAENGFLPAQGNLALIYSEQGKHEEAVKWFKKAAIQGNVYSQFRLADAYYKGEGVEKNLAEAKKWAQKAADQEFESAQELLELINDEISETNSAEKNEEKRSEADSTDSSTLSKTVVYQENETQEFLLKQAEAGSVDAMFKYSWRCRNDEEASKWMKKAAEKGDARAQFYLGHAYTDGYIKGVKADEKLALKWLTSASQKGFPLAKAFCLYKGIGVKLDKDKAWKELERSAEDGWVESQFALGLLYSGLYCPFNFPEIDKNKDKAEYWLTKAAQNGYAEAKFQLGMSYLKQKNEDGVKWLTQAAVQGYAPAQYYLAEAYYEGDVVEKNLAEAKKWVQKAADQKFSFAKDLIKKINGENGNEENSDDADDPFDDNSEEKDDAFDNDSENEDDPFL